MGEKGEKVPGEIVGGGIMGGLVFYMEEFMEAYGNHWK